MVLFFLWETRVSSSRSLALHSPQQHFAFPPSETKTTRWRNLFPPRMELYRSLDISKRKIKTPSLSHIKNRGISRLFRSGRVPLKSLQKHQISSVDVQCVHEVKSLCVKPWSLMDVSVGPGLSRVPSVRRVRVCACWSSLQLFFKAFNLYTFSSPTSAAGQAGLSHLRPYLYWNPN